jgi:hypothetical protein
MAYPHNCLIENAQAKISLNCVSCQTPHNLTVPAQNYMDWRNGTYIQNALSMLNKDDREMLVSGICPECWDAMFGDDDDG